MPTKNNEVEITINRENPDKLTPNLVNDLVITTDGSTFFLTFSLIEAPDINTLDPRNPSISSIAKSKLIMTPAFFEGLIGIFTHALGQHGDIINRGNNNE